MFTFELICMLLEVYLKNFTLSGFWGVFKNSEIFGFLAQAQPAQAIFQCRLSLPRQFFSADSACVGKFLAQAQRASIFCPVLTVFLVQASQVGIFLAQTQPAQTFLAHAQYAQPFLAHTQHAQRPWIFFQCILSKISKQFRDSSGPCSVDTSRSCTALCSVDKSRCSSVPFWCRYVHVQHRLLQCRQVQMQLKVHKREIFQGADFEFFTISQLLMHKW